MSGMLRDATAAVKRLLSRESSSVDFIPEIDGLRFIAIMSVIFYHLNGYVTTKLGADGSRDMLSSFLRKGDFGVPLFFVISGFIISFPFARRAMAGLPPVQIRRYLTRRLTRLEPPYIISLIVMLALLVYLKGESMSGLLPHFGASAVYVHNVIFGRPSDINVVAWSLEVECQFYLLAPLLVSVFRLKSVSLRRAVLAAAIVVASLVGGLLLPPASRWSLSLVHYASYFLTGFLLADVFLVTWKSAPEKSLMWDVIGIVSWIAIASILYLPPQFRALMPLPILGAYCAAFRGRLSNRLFRHPLIYVIGGMCYTIYLYHWLVISAVGRYALQVHAMSGLSLGGALALMALMVVPPVIFISAVLFVVFEKPFMRVGWHVKLKERLQLAFARTSYD